MKTCEISKGSEMWRYFLAAVALSTSAPAFADDSDSAKSIILESIKAHGGKEALKEFAFSRKSGSGSAQNGDELERIEYVHTRDLPSRAVSHVSFSSASGKSTYSYYLNGKQLSVSINGIKLPIVEDGLWEAKEELEYVSYLLLLYPLLEAKSVRLARMDDQTIAGRDCHVVRATVKNRPCITFFFDRESDLNIGMDVGGNRPSRYLYSDLREYNGLKYFSALRCIRDGKVVREEVIKKLEFLDKIDDSEFVGPPKR
jgi:hypothetical protein